MFKKLLWIFLSVFISCLYAQDNRQILLDKGFLEKIPENPNVENITSELSTMPVPTGPYRVGVKTYEIEDETRDGRLIPFWVCFPLQKGDQKAYPQMIEEKGLDLFEARDVDQKLNIQVYSKQENDLSALKGTGKHPVIFFNHGQGMLLNGHSFILEDLASHGYIVVSIQHQLKSDKQDANKRLINYPTVVNNMLFVFQWLKENNNKEFYDSLNLKRLGCIGYSMGANSVVLFASHGYRHSSATLFPHDSKDDVKECIIAIDPQMFPFPLNNNYPVFLLFAEKREAEQIKSGEYDFMKHLGHKFAYYKNTSHASFSDIAYLNIKTHLQPDARWFYGTTEERMRFFDDVRKDIREFLQEHLQSENSLNP